jgi:hypothetical protein
MKPALDQKAALMQTALDVCLWPILLQKSVGTGQEA